MLLSVVMFGGSFAGFADFSAPPGGSCYDVVTCIGALGGNIGWMLNLLFIKLPAGLLAMTTLAGTGVPVPIAVLYTIAIVVGVWIPFIAVAADFIAGVLP